MEQVLGIESGGDDYVTKPFHLDVLHANIKALLRRAYGAYAQTEPVHQADPALTEVGRLATRMAANARMLFMISILTAGILVPLGMGASVYTNAEGSVLRGEPVALMVVGEPSGLSATRTSAILREHGMPASAEAHLTALVGRSEDMQADPWPAPSRRVLVLSVGGFNRWLVDVLRVAPFSLEEGRAALVERWGGTNGAWTTLHLQLGDAVEALPIFRSARFLMLYFSLFTQLTEDKRQFQALYKLGLGADGVRRIVSTQTAVLFFAPFLVGLAHAAAIVQMLTMQSPDISVWQPLVAVGAAYGLLLVGYNLVTRRTYARPGCGRMEFLPGWSAGPGDRAGPVRRRGAAGACVAAVAGNGGAAHGRFARPLAAEPRPAR